MPRSLQLERFPVNVGPWERMACAVLAGWILAGAVRRKNARVAALVAGALAFRALSGNCKAYEITGISTCPRR